MFFFYTITVTEEYSSGSIIGAGGRGGVLGGRLLHTDLPFKSCDLNSELWEAALGRKKKVDLAMAGFKPTPCRALIHATNYKHGSFLHFSHSVVMYKLLPTVYSLFTFSIHRLWSDDTSQVCDLNLR